MPKGYRADGTPIRPPGPKVGTEAQRATAVLLAQATNAEPEQFVESYSEEDMGGATRPLEIKHTTFGQLPIYVLTPSGSQRRNVAVQSIGEVLRQPHYSATCHDCGRSDCRSDLDLNNCTGRPARLYRVCPIETCSKRVYDPKATGKHRTDEYDNSGRNDKSDPNVITSETDYQSTPASRTKSMLDDHMVGFHPSEASSMGIGQRVALPKMVVV